MTPALYARAKDVFLEVCDLPEGERAAWLEQLCAGDPQLRAGVQELLEGEAEGLSLERAGAAVRADLEGPEPLPRVPGFTLLERLGEGGMGSVYRAEQREPVQRVVALKLMRASLQGTSARARFQAERRALARFAHPNVAAMYEAGATEEGFPYFAMELVEGRPLVDDCDRRRLTVRERLALFVAVCRAVEHAHRKGILHRDLKPSNVLVTEVEGKPVPKVIDFGIARVLESPGPEAETLTVGGFVGTPGYMSPEALSGSGDLDTRADVYSLGVLLHELLAGVRPHLATSASLSDLIVEVTRTDPPPLVERFRALPPDAREAIAHARGSEPPALAKELGGDLTWIVRKATARSREERYGSAAELAEELSRVLEDLPVCAAPPSFRDRAVKLVRRHRAAVVASVLVLLAVVVGVIGLATGLVRARREQRIAETERKNADTERTKAETERKNAEEVSKFLTQLVTSTSPWNRSGEGTVGQLLVEAARMAPERLRDQPRRQGDLLHAIGEALFHATRLRDGERVLRQALSVRREAFGPRSIEAARTMRSLSVAIRRGEDSVRTPERYAEAETLLRDCVAIRQALGRDGASGCVFDLGDLLLETGRAPEAGAAYLASLEMRERQLAAGEASANDVVVSAVSYGHLMALLGCLEEADRSLTAAVALAEKAAGRKSFVYARALTWLGELRLDQRRLEEAERIEEEVLDVQSALIPPTDGRNNLSLTVLGAAQRRLGRLPEAERSLDRTIALIASFAGADSSGLRSPLTELALLRLEQGRRAEAKALLARALRPPEELDYYDRRDHAAAHAALAEVLWAEGAREQASASCQRALAMRESILAPGSGKLEEARRKCAEMVSATTAPSRARPSPPATPAPR